MKPVLTAVVGTNADLIPDVLKLYVPGGEVIDMTYGLGVFWKNVDLSGYKLVKNDIDPERGDVHEDFRQTHWEDGYFDAVILDPPYASRSGSLIKASIDRGYNNAKRALKDGIYGTENVMQFYRDGINEAMRVVKPGGYIMVKCMDEIMGGKQQRNHITIWNYAQNTGLLDVDLFVLVQNGIPTMRHNYQLHARKNNSFLWVFQKAVNG